MKYYGTAVAEPAGTGHPMNNFTDEPVWIVEIHDEDGDIVEVAPINALDRETALERAYPRVLELREEYEDDNLIAGRVYPNA